MIVSRMGIVGFGSLSLLVLLVSSGCGGPGYGSSVKVTGTVTVDDKPLADASVTFHSTEGREAEFSNFTATTGGDGKYELADVYPGAYEVIVAEGGGESGEGMEDPGMASATAGQDLQPVAGELKTEVGSEDHTFDVKLKRGRVPRQ
ncbi:MAG: carboxypeptidase regulatory-like domain-containing protein [Planctomycetes bacterium]|nr:carboxypeptidase regulatory-like domain-containing protein [Planctomycetota bacterium]